MTDERIAELLKKIEAIESDPANRATDGGLYLYVPKARKRLAKRRDEIAAVMAQKRAAEGRPVAVAGYSGRQTNRR